MRARAKSYSWLCVGSGECERAGSGPPFAGINLIKFKRYVSADWGSQHPWTSREMGCCRKSGTARSLRSVSMSAFFLHFLTTQWHGACTETRSSHIMRVYFRVRVVANTGKEDLAHGMMGLCYPGTTIYNPILPCWTLPPVVGLPAPPSMLEHRRSIRQHTSLHRRESRTASTNHVNRELANLRDPT